ncbi:M50 family metallopeptidase [Paenibacillus sp. ACRSA]|uniref:M50 family metallopeptidase n=1 Tax=Paenibacillus sp. ACRSA TaxID=2918211 RepID=UPI001EF594D9|nr:M50 family metallopeptidase [Paenibacillus sp. ACRSA]MCG7379714.1 M50 family metallopeptidase [Paenibacillus sp. ACRSA]
MNKWLKTILFLIVSVFLTRFIPFSSLFRNLDTMIHEFGHAVATLLLSGKVLRIELYADHSGVTYSTMLTPGRSIIVSLAGYISASLFAWLLFYLYRKGRHMWGLGIITAIALVSLLLYVRGEFGMLWLTGFIALNVVIMIFGAKIVKFYYLFLAFLTLEESVLTAMYVGLLSWTQPSRAGDAANLAQQTFMPAMFWGTLFALFALWCAKGALALFFRKESNSGRTSRSRGLSK